MPISPLCHFRVVFCFILFILIPLQIKIVSADEPSNPYELYAPNGGTLTELPSGEYLLHIRPPVKILQGEMTMIGDNGWIYQNQQKAVLDGNVTIYDNKRTLNADQAIYHKQQRKIILDHRVMLTDFERQIVADHMVYWRDLERVEANGHIVLDDFKEKVTLQGNHGVYDDKTEVANFDLNPQLMWVGEKGDSTYMRADQMQYFSGQQRAIANGNVSIRYDQTRAYCEHAELLRREDRIVLTGRPVVAYEDSALVSEIQGDSIQIRLEDKRLREIIVIGQAIAIHWPKNAQSDDQIGKTDTLAAATDSLTRTAPEPVNIASGERIDIHVGRKYVEKVLVTGMASSVYYPEVKSAENQDRNDVRGDLIELAFLRGKLQAVTVTGDCAGVYAFPKKGK